MQPVEFVLSPLVAFFVGVFFLGFSRKLTARIQRRYGPPLYQPVIDVVKLFAQRSISHGVLFEVGVVVSLVGSVITVMFIPLGRICPLCSSGGLLVVMYLMLFGPLGLALGAGESANPNASIGVSRKMLLALAYEVPFLLVILSVMCHYGTISLAEIVAQQQAGRWGLLSLPLALSALAAFLILPAMLGIRPFDLVSAPQEIASGPLVEYGGRYLAVIAIQGAFHSFIVIALFVDFFLGGGTNVGTFLLKVLVVFAAGVLINAVLPRVKIEEAIKFCWKWPVALAVVSLALSVVLR